MIKECLENVRKNVPLVHNITNYVTVNDVANVILACGGSPIMSDDEDDAPDITSICGGLNINIGTLNKNTIPSMYLAGKRANELGHVVLLDPVGAGASKLRTDTAVGLMRDVKFDVIRGNISEIKTLAYGSGSTKGVDADVADAVTEDTLDGAVTFVKKLSAETGSIIAVTGAIDLVADSEKCAYVVANPDNNLEAAAAAVMVMGLAGEIGYSHLQTFEGNSTYRNRIIDAVYNMDGDTLEKGARYEIR